MYIFHCSAFHSYMGLCILVLSPHTNAVFRYRKRSFWETQRKNTVFKKIPVYEWTRPATVFTEWVVAQLSSKSLVISQFCPSLPAAAGCEQLPAAVMSGRGHEDRPMGRQLSA